MKLDITFANEIKRTGNGDGGREHRFAIMKELHEIADELNNRDGFDDCLKKYGRAKVALCVAATIVRSQDRYEQTHVAWAQAVLELWTNRTERGILDVLIVRLHPAYVAGNSRGLIKAVSI